jgi:uncharacterized phage protein (TIGR01671 family)
VSDIQFRVWCKSKKRYVDNVSILIGASGDPVLWQADKPAIELSREDYIFELRSAYTDTNGKPIFEGDILRWMEGVDGYKHKYAAVVEFDGRYFKLHSETGGWSSLELLPVGLVVVGTRNEILSYGREA